MENQKNEIAKDQELLKQTDKVSKAALALMPYLSTFNNTMVVMSHLINEREGIKVGEEKIRECSHKVLDVLEQYFPMNGDQVMMIAAMLESYLVETISTIIKKKIARAFEPTPPEFVEKKEMN